MRNYLLSYLRRHPGVLSAVWQIAHVFFQGLTHIIPVKKRTMLITSFAGRKYDDSPRALYEFIISRTEFDDWDIIWAFVNPDEFSIPRGRKIKIDTWRFFVALLYSKVWISNSGMDRNIRINRKGTVKIETWHGTPLKKIGQDQNEGVLGNYKPSTIVDSHTIRCAQSEYDRDIFARIFNADKACFLMCDLPRNDNLTKYSDDDKMAIRKKLNIAPDKRVLLYMPTYREYLINERNQTYLSPPINMDKWEAQLNGKYVLLIRAHYAVTASLNINDTEFLKDVSNYSYINDLYAVSDVLISDYSSSFFDFSILDKPMLCFAYDEAEYIEKRGLYMDLHQCLPCPIAKNEDELLNYINNLNYEQASYETRRFHLKYAPHSGYACDMIVERLLEQLAPGYKS